MTYKQIRNHLAPTYRLTDDEDRFLRLIIDLPESGRQQGVSVLESFAGTADRLEERLLEGADHY